MQPANKQHTTAKTAKKHRIFLAIACIVALGAGVTTWGLLATINRPDVTPNDTSVPSNTEEHPQETANDSEPIGDKADEKEIATDPEEPKADASKQQPSNGSPAKKPTKKPQPKPRVTRGTMSLAVDLSSKTYSWSYTGKAPYGYSLVWSTTNVKPRLNAAGTFAIPLNLSSSQQTGPIPDTLPIEPGQTYYVTICAFTNGTHKSPCVDYAKNVTLELHGAPQ